jgi:SSS family solute:Na+ symporter
VVAFFVKYVKGTAAFWGMVLAQATVLGIYFYGKAVPAREIGYLWLNPIGVAACVMFSVMLQAVFGGRSEAGSAEGERT